jgi:hypothetical protein
MWTKYKAFLTLKQVVYILTIVVYRITGTKAENVALKQVFSECFGFP